VAAGLSSVIGRGIEVVIESMYGGCVFYSPWTLFRHVVKAKTLKDQFQNIS
jgi:hypothetical protein